MPLSSGPAHAHLMKGFISYSPYSLSKAFTKELLYSLVRPYSLEIDYTTINS